MRDFVVYRDYKGIPYIHIGIVREYLIYICTYIYIRILREHIVRGLLGT